jgi:hypothetical protein
MDLNEFAKSYICLGLRINKHIDGYVEHYYGPPELKKMVDIEEKLSPISLLKNYQDLEKTLPNQGFEQKRYKFLSKTLTAIETTLRMLKGEYLPYLEQSEKLFDMEPVLYDDTYFYNLSSRADKLYIGEGTLSERIQTYAMRRKIPQNQLMSLYKKAIEIARKQSNIIFPNLLPDNEIVLISEVKDQSWAMYNWYQGNYTSRIDIDINKTHYWTNILHLACHEGYPGHHMDRTLHDRELYRNKGYFENSILLIYSPEMVISEGIGEIAEFVVFEPTESIRISLEEFCLNPKIEDDLEVLIEQSEIRRGFGKFESNLAYLKYVHGLSDDELLKYSRNFEVLPDTTIKSILKFISDELWAPYSIVYQGERLITDKFGFRPSSLNFGRLLTEQTLPSDL